MQFERFVMQVKIIEESFVFYVERNFISNFYPLILNALLQPRRGISRYLKSW